MFWIFGLWLEEPCILGFLRPEPPCPPQAGKLVKFDSLGKGKNRVTSKPRPAESEDDEAAEDEKESKAEQSNGPAKEPLLHNHENMGCTFTLCQGA